MILVDANLLLYAYDSTSPYHASARDWIEEVMSGAEPFGLAWITITAFLRIATNPRAFEKPLSIAEAAGIVSEWLELPTVHVVEPGERHWEILQELLLSGQCRGPLVMDAHLAALAIEHGLTLCSNDRDFSRFPRLRVSNPVG